MKIPNKENGELTEWVGEDVGTSAAFEEVIDT
jgi:hypothetical protein